MIRLVVLMYVKYPLSLRNVEDLLAKRGIDICHETVRLWWNRFGPMFAAEIRRTRVDHTRAFHNHFNQDRHLINRDDFKARRSAAFAEWKMLAS